MRITILLLLLILAFSVYGYAASGTEEKEFQEQCGKSADKFFGRAIENGFRSDDKKTETMDYRHHYNRKLNKCFILVTTTILPKFKDETVVLFKELLDISEMKAYGEIFAEKNGNKPFGCKVLERFCHSEGEWDSLVKPYMEE